MSATESLAAGQLLAAATLAGDAANWGGKQTLCWVGRQMMDGTKPASVEEQIATFRKLRREKRDGYSRWLLLIKELRVRNDASILEAERIALSSPHRRRWVETQINTSQRCRKYALAHIRHNGKAALIEREGETFNFSIPP